MEDFVSLGESRVLENASKSEGSWRAGIMGGRMGLPTIGKVASRKDGPLLVEAQQNVVETQNGIWVDPSPLGWITSMSESAPRFLHHFLFYFESFVILNCVLRFTSLFLPISPLLITNVLHLYLVPLSVKAQLSCVLLATVALYLVTLLSGVTFVFLLCTTSLFWFGCLYIQVISRMTSCKR